MDRSLDLSYLAQGRYGLLKSRQVRDRLDKGLREEATVAPSTIAEKARSELLALKLVPDMLVCDA
ncbi:MAG: hypothetical protein IPN47_14625 [Gemmatimonadetes bacterium]|nr:hypothetical protein [Gemmatimonadota bacterium]